MKELRKVDVLSYHPLRPGVTDSTQDPFSMSQGMEGTTITRNSLTVTKFPHNVTCRIVRAMVKPNQRNTVILEAQLTIYVMHHHSTTHWTPKMERHFRNSMNSAGSISLFLGLQLR